MLTMGEFELPTNHDIGTQEIDIFLCLFSSHTGSDHAFYRHDAEGAKRRQCFPLASSELAPWEPEKRSQVLAGIRSLEDADDNRIWPSPARDEPRGGSTCVES